MNRWFEVYAYPLKASATDYRVAVLFTEITERKQAEEALRTSEQNFRELTASLEERVAERTDQVRSLVTQLTMSEQEERRRISQILHDDLQQRLFGIQYQVAEIVYSLTTKASTEDSTDALATMAEMRASLDDLIEIARNLSVDLSPPILHDEGLTEAIRWLAGQIERQYGLVVAVQAEVGLPQLHEDLRVLLFQTVRELLFNIVKHAGITTAVVSLNRNSQNKEQLCIEVRDLGRGFIAGSTAESKRNSQGLQRIRQRLQLIGGNLAIESAPEQGTKVTLYSPKANDP